MIRATLFYSPPPVILGWLLPATQIEPPVPKQKMDEVPVVAGTPGGKGDKGDKGDPGDDLGGYDPGDLNLYFENALV